MQEEACGKKKKALGKQGRKGKRPFFLTSSFHTLTVIDVTPPPPLLLLLLLLLVLLLYPRVPTCRSAVVAEVGISVIDTNQEPPIFENSRYTFGAAEDVPPGSSVGTVTAVSSSRGEAGQGEARTGEMGEARRLESVAKLGKGGKREVR